MIRGALLATAVFAIPASLAQSGQPPADPSLLVPGSLVDRHLARGDEHKFQLALADGFATTIVIEQRAPDVRALERDANGTPIATGWTRLGRQAKNVSRLQPARLRSMRAAGDRVIWTRRAATGGDRRIRIAIARAQSAQRAGRCVEARGCSNARSRLPGMREPGQPVPLCDPAMHAERQDNAGSLLERCHSPPRQKAWGPLQLSAIARSAALLERFSGQRRRRGGPSRARCRAQHTIRTDHRGTDLVTTLANRARASDLQQSEDPKGALVNRAHGNRTLLGRGHQQPRQACARGTYAAAERCSPARAASEYGAPGARWLFVAAALQNLGIMARERKDYAAAVAAYRDACIDTRAHPRRRSPKPGRADQPRQRVSLTGDDRKALGISARCGGPASVPTAGAAPSRATSRAHACGRGATSLDLAEAFSGRRWANTSPARAAKPRSCGIERRRTLSLHQAGADNEDAAALAALVPLQREGASRTR